MRVVPMTSMAKMAPWQLALVQRVGTPKNFATTFVFGGLNKQVRTEDRVIDSDGGPLRLRVYSPRRTPETPRPLVVAIHGGGWVLGGLNPTDWMCSTIADGLDAIVVSVEYRLAPEHPFPSGLDDCFRALAWSTENAAMLGATAGRTGIVGDSAGGNLAAVVSLLARDAGGPPIHHQALLYPAIDAAAATDSYRHNKDAPMLTAADMDAYYGHYVGARGDRLDWRVSPLRAASHRFLPPALIQVAGHDPLHDEGVQYAAVLRANGVPVKLTEYPAMPHGFLSFPRFNRDAGPALQEVIDEQRRALRPQTKQE
jgi:acetyl esterase